MSAPVVLDGASLTVADVIRVARDPSTPVAASPAAMAALARSRSIVESALASGEPLYGINTGFGKLANVRIAPDQLHALQRNLLRSHAAGVGTPLPDDVVRALLLLRANVLLRPTSGVRPVLVEALLRRLREHRLPVVPEQGSVGASGDLAPLAHVALALLEEDGVEFEPKEGLAFINGTQAQTAMLALLTHDALVLWRTAIAAAAMSHEALRATPVPLDPRIHAARPHRGQQEAADRMRILLDRSEIRESHRHGDPRVQDAYSLRCAPQVLGAVRDTIRFAEEVVAVELNASTDNPLVFEEGEGGVILSGGNFHGQPVAQALDLLAIGLTTLQAIAERRVERLVNPDLSHGLPAFLTGDPGLSSGFMMVQITAAALVAESRTLCHPASIGSIPTDANQEDFVPMGMAAAWKAQRILRNAALVVASEVLCGAQGIDLLAPLRPGVGVAVLHQRVRREVGIAPLTADRPPGPDLDRLAAAVLTGKLAPGVDGPYLF